MDVADNFVCGTGVGMAVVGAAWEWFSAIMWQHLGAERANPSLYRDSGAGWAQVNKARTRARAQAPCPQRLRVLVGLSSGIGRSATRCSWLCCSLSASVYSWPTAPGDSERSWQAL